MIYGKLEDHRLSRTFSIRFDERAFSNIFERFRTFSTRFDERAYTFSSLPHICEDSFPYFISYNLYIILSYIINPRKLTEYVSGIDRSFRRYHIGFLVQMNL